MEFDFELMEGVGRRFRVTFVGKDAAVLPADAFLVYGAAFSPGCEQVIFKAEREDGCWLLTMPGLCANKRGWQYQVIAAQYETGVEWLILDGSIEVEARIAGDGDGVVVEPNEVPVECKVGQMQMEVDVQLGDSSALCVEAAKSAGLAAGSAEEDANAAANSATDAANSASEAAASAGLARERATAAATSSKAAADSATDAATSSKAAADSATDAATSSKAAADSASDAIEAAERAEAGATEAAASVSDARAAYELRYSAGMPEVLESSSAYDLGVVTGEVDLSGLRFEEREDIVQTAELWMDCGAGVRVIWPDGCIWVGDEPELAEGVAYRLVVRQEKVGKILISVAYEYVAE